MATTEEQGRRHDLHAECRAIFTSASADELMAGLAPPGWNWSDMATKADLRDGLSALEDRLDARFSALESKFDARCSALESRFDGRLSALESRFDVGAASLGQELAEGLRRQLAWTVGAIVGSGALLGAIVGLLGGG